MADLQTFSGATRVRRPDEEFLIAAKVFRSIGERSLVARITPNGDVGSGLKEHWSGNYTFDPQRRSLFSYTAAAAPPTGDKLIPVPATPAGVSPPISASETRSHQRRCNYFVTMTEKLRLLSRPF